VIPVLNTLVAENQVEEKLVKMIDAHKKHFALKTTNYREENEACDCDEVPDLEDSVRDFAALKMQFPTS